MYITCCDCMLKSFCCWGWLDACRDHAFQPTLHAALQFAWRT